MMKKNAPYSSARRAQNQQVAQSAPVEEGLGARLRRAVGMQAPSEGARPDQKTPMKNYGTDRPRDTQEVKDYRKTLRDEVGM